MTIVTGRANGLTDICVLNFVNLWCCTVRPYKNCIHTCCTVCWCGVTWSAIRMACNANVWGRIRAVSCQTCSSTCGSTLKKPEIAFATNRCSRASTKLAIGVTKMGDYQDFSNSQLSGWVCESSRHIKPDVIEDICMNESPIESRISIVSSTSAIAIINTGSTLSDGYILPCWNKFEIHISTRRPLINQDQPCY